MKDFNLFNYGNFIKQFIQGFKEDLGVTLKPDTSNGTIPEYPFVTYSFINNHVDIGYSKENQPQFDIVLQFTTHSNKLSESLDTANALIVWFKDNEVQYQLFENGIEIIRLYDQTVLNNVMAIDTDRRVNFEARFRVNNVESYENNPSIERISANNGAIDVQKKGN